MALKAAAGNGASQHVAEANGFRRTGLERQAERLGDGSYDDLVDYDRLATDDPGVLSRPGQARDTPLAEASVGARRRLPVDPVHMTSVAGSPGRSTPPAAGTSLRDALIAIGVVMTALVFTEYVVPSRSRASVAAIVDVISVAAFTVTGLVAWHRRPHNLTGRLMVAAALALWAAGMQEDEIEILSAVGILMDSLPLAVLIHLLLAFPSGRLVGHASRVTVAVGYVIALVPPWLQELTESETAVTAIGTAQTAIGIAALAVTFVLASRRLSHTPAVVRRQLLPFVGYGCFAVAVIGVCIALSHTDLDTAALDVVLIIQVAMICGLPIAFVIAMTVGAFGRAGEVEEVALGISEASAEPALLDDLMVRALGDPSARVLWATKGGFVDSDGRPLEVDEDSGGGRSEPNPHRWAVSPTTAVWSPTRGSSRPSPRPWSWRSTTGDSSSTSARPFSSSTRQPRRSGHPGGASSSPRTRNVDASPEISTTARSNASSSPVSRCRGSLAARRMLSS